MVKRRPDVRARWEKHRHMNSIPGLSQQISFAQERLKVETDQNLITGWNYRIKEWTAKLAQKQSMLNFQVPIANNNQDRRAKHPFNTMAINQKVTHTDKTTWRKFSDAAYSYSRKSGKVFSCHWDKYEQIGTVERTE